MGRLKPILVVINKIDKPGSDARAREVLDETFELFD